MFECDKKTNNIPIHPYNNNSIAITIRIFECSNVRRKQIIIQYTNTLIVKYRVFEFKKNK